MSRKPDRVVMIGTDPGTHGGIAAALGTWDAAGLFASWPVTYIPTHCDGTRARKLARALAALARFAGLVLRVRCAILHVHGASRASFWRKAPFMALALAARWPVVFHLHGGGFAQFYQRECGAVRKAFVRWFLERAACVLVVSECWGSWVRTVVSHDRVACVPNAVVSKGARPARPSGQRIAFLGRLIEDKGVFELLEAFARVRKHHPGATLELAGDGDTRAVLRRARALGVAAHVRLLGWVDEAARDELLAGATVLALPSHFEGAPMSLLEAMAAEVPVVASHAGGIPDIVRDGENGLLFPCGDIAALAAALGRVLDDPDFAGRLGRAGRASVELRHSPEAAVETLGRIYSNLGQRPLYRPLALLHRHPACT
jgi:glycosyltransferase involved in cell wall biosynthesis